jgi:nucleotide-binding universal stress UspA family protein
MDRSDVTPTPFGEIVVALDGFDNSAKALEPAAKLAAALDLPTSVVTVTRPGLARWRAQEIRAQIHALTDSPDLALHVLDHDETSTGTARALTEWLRTRQHPLLVMTTTGRGLSAAWCGTVATAVLRRHGGPVLLLGPRYRPGSFEPNGPIVVGLDGTPAAEGVLDAATAISRQLGNHMELVQVVSPDDVSQLQRAPSGDIAMESHYLQHTADALQHSLGQLPNYDVRHDTDPAKALSRTAGELEASMIATTTRARLGPDRLWHGSTTAELALYATSPLLTVTAISTETHNEKPKPA